MAIKIIAQSTSHACSSNCACAEGFIIIVLWRRFVYPQPLYISAVAYALSCLGQEDIVLKEKQSEAIKSIYEEKDVFAWLPTGYGKSLRYQLLLFLFDFKLGRPRAIAHERSVALVISPLVSLRVH